jgi:beta-lactamase class A
MTWQDVLERRIRAITTGIAAQWGVYVRFLDDGREIAIDADRRQDTMSLVKIPILVALMRAVDRGEVDLSTRLVLAEDDKRPGTGVLFLMDAGASLTLGDAARLMIVVSDNTATDLCLAAIGGPQQVNAQMRALGIADIEMTGDALTWFRALAGSMDEELARIPPGEFVRRGYPRLGPAGLADRRADYHFGGGRPFSLASARAIGTLLLAIHEERCASPAACRFMKAVLAGQQMRTMAPKHLWGVAAAHKTGNFHPHIASDAGVFTPAAGSPFILTVMTQRYEGPRALLEESVARIAELVAHAAERSGG